jgi:hypothetical protein
MSKRKWEIERNATQTAQILVNESCMKVENALRMRVGI